MAIETKKL